MNKAVNAKQALLQLHQLLPVHLKHLHLSVVNSATISCHIIISCTTQQTVAVATSCTRLHNSYILIYDNLC